MSTHKPSKPQTTPNVDPAVFTSPATAGFPLTIFKPLCQLIKLRVLNCQPTEAEQEDFAATVRVVRSDAKERYWLPNGYQTPHLPIALKEWALKFQMPCPERP